MTFREASIEALRRQGYSEDAVKYSLDHADQLSVTKGREANLLVPPECVDEAISLLGRELSPVEEKRLLEIYKSALPSLN